MFLLKWYREYLEIKYERAARTKDLDFCSACETLKLQLAIATDERKFLIEKLTKSEGVETVRDLREVKPIQPNRLNWNMHRQMLEAEDREKAKLIKKREEEEAKPEVKGKDLTIHEIEKELGVENG